LPHEVGSHYERLAENYDQNWAHTPEYVEWMNTRIETALPVSPGDRVADVGAGTGLFLRRLMDHANADVPILCLDPSQPMLDRIPQDPRVTPICATAEEVAAGKTEIPYDNLDAILIKETIHHVEDIPGTLAGLAGLLAPGGRIYVVTLPPRLDYPLFQAALDRFAARQPKPEDIATAMSDAGLTAELEYDQFPVSVDRDYYIDLVGTQWMSVLSSFTDEELAAGLDEMRAKHTGPRLEFVDRFGFVLGVKPG
jgi:ubiquinone/menaquinone biosynthesis C-methylase UbiE